MPETYCPHFSLVDEAIVKYCRENRIKLVPWTVNDFNDLERMKSFGSVDVITDYPDRAARVFRE